MGTILTLINLSAETTPAETTPTNLALEGRSNRTKFVGVVSAEEFINASIGQRSGTGPANIVVTISKLKPRHAANRLFKYADDGYLIVPASSASTIQSELQSQTSSRALGANLTLNLGKTQEMIITRSNCSCHKQTIPFTAGLTRVEHMKILGVTFSSSFTFDKHVDTTCRLSVRERDRLNTPSGSWHLEPCAGRAAADNLWAPPPTFVDRRAAAADNLSARRRYHCCYVVIFGNFRWLLL